MSGDMELIKVPCPLARPLPSKICNPINLSVGLAGGFRNLADPRLSDNRRMWFFPAAKPTGLVEISCVLLCS